LRHEIPGGALDDRQRPRIEPAKPIWAAIKTDAVNSIETAASPAYRAVRARWRDELECSLAVVV
jgi:hypothetical protein